MRTEALIQLRYDTGVHLNEALNTKWAWINLDDKTLTIPVSSLRSTTDEETNACAFDFSADTVRVLAAHSQNRLGRDDNPVFTGPEGGQLPGDIARNAIITAPEAMGIRPHRVADTRCDLGKFPAQFFRNSAAYRMLTVENRLLEEVSQFVRHPDVDTTTYLYRVWRDQ